MTIPPSSIIIEAGGMIARHNRLAAKVMPPITIDNLFRNFLLYSFIYYSFSVLYSHFTVLIVPSTAFIICFGMAAMSIFQMSDFR